MFVYKLQQLQIADLVRNEWVMCDFSQISQKPQFRRYLMRQF